MEAVSRDHALAIGSALELYEEELRDLRDEIQEALDYRESGESEDARSVWLSEGDWRCVRAFLEVALSSAAQVPDAVPGIPNPSSPNKDRT